MGEDDKAKRVRGFEAEVEGLELKYQIKQAPFIAFPIKAMSPEVRLAIEIIKRNGGKIMPHYVDKKKKIILP